MLVAEVVIHGHEATGVAGLGGVCVTGELGVLGLAVHALIRTRRLGWHVRDVMHVAHDGASGFDGRVDGLHIVHLIDIFLKSALALFGLIGLDTTTARKSVHEGVVVPFLEGDTAGIEALVIGLYELLSVLLFDDHTRVTPREVVLFPEGVERESEREDGESKDVDNHPANMLPLPLDDEDDGLQSVDSGQQDNRNNRELSRLSGDQINEISDIGAGRRKDDGTQKINEDDETHAETAETTHVL